MVFKVMKGEWFINDSDCREKGVYASLYDFRRRGKKFWLAFACIGGGEGAVVLLDAVPIGLPLVGLREVRNPKAAVSVVATAEINLS